MAPADLKNWQPRQCPQKKTLEGRYVRLVPLSAQAHGDSLFEVSSVSDAQTRFLYLPEYPPENRDTFQFWLEKAEASTDPLYFAVIDQATGKVTGRQTLMRIDSASGVVEIGHIYWGPLMAQKAAATEAQFLFARYLFDELGYRRYEWKCNNQNEPSKRAATRFGFKPEGLFRQHSVVKGENRDTAWFSIIDLEWPALRAAYEQWLTPSNFDAAGLQKKRLEAFRAECEA